MKKEDLKNGDWVCYIYDNLPYKIIGESGYHVIINRIEGDMSHTERVGYESFYSILLTEKILLDNGWHKTILYPHDFKLNKLILSNKGDCFSVCMQDSPMQSIHITNIHYVHELQHILWAHKTGCDISTVYKPEPIVKWKVFQLKLQLTFNPLDEDRDNPKYIVTPRCIGTTSSHGKPSLDTIFHICNYYRWDEVDTYDFSQPITVEDVTFTPTLFFTGECQSDIYVTTENKNEVIVCDSAGWKALNSVSEAQAYMLKNSPYFNTKNITNKEDFDL